MIENLIVAVIVVVALLYIVRKYLPAGWRLKLVYRLTARGASQAKMAQWLNTQSNCGSGCDTCKSCAEPEPSTERVIKITRR